MSIEASFGPERWEPEICDRFQAKTHHEFILHQNIFDYVKKQQGTTSLLVEYLMRAADRWQDGKKFSLKIRFSQSSGFDFYDEEQEDGQMTNMEEIFRRVAKLPADSPLPHQPHEAFPIIEKALLQDDHPILVIIEYLEKIAPASSRGGQPAATPLVIETLHRWGHDLRIRDCRNLILLLTYNIGQVDECLYAANSGCWQVAISLPSEPERLSYISYVANNPKVGLARLDQGMMIESLARNTTGFSLRALDETNRLAQKKKIPITWLTIRERKKEIIQAESEGLLEIVEPPHGFQDVGGLSKVKEYLRKIAEIVIKNRRSPIIPKGLLFVGPPGVGKTHIAQAFAKESSINFVIMRNVRSKWVGESERNLTRVFNLARSIAPVCIFVDEVDQALGNRGSGSGDSGVSQRIFGRILEEMGNNENRGELLWICATNRPDYMDSAMISRFDRVIPFLLPTPEEREEILRALAGYLKIDYALGTNLADFLDSLEELTGREIEIILRRAIEIAQATKITSENLKMAIDDFKPNHDPSQYRLQALLAIQATNLRHFLPDDIPYADILENGRVDPKKLDESIKSLKGSNWA